MKNLKYLIFAGMFIVAISGLDGVGLLSNKVFANDSNFTDEIMVDSVGDGADVNLSDSICDDGSGNCTLRAALEEANDKPGADIINFNIPGTGLHTIQPNSSLPAITEQVEINGYSQPGSKENTAISPAPLNGILLIEIDGTNAGQSSDGLNISSSATSVAIEGLVINRFSFRGIGGNYGGTDTTIHGCYIGTDPTGLIDRGNADQGLQLGPNAKIGGVNPADRNIISGNEGGGASPNVGDNNWVVKGNYIGLGADGETVISNSQFGNTGAMSIDNSTGHIIGGTEVGATNVISGNRSFGLFPDNVSNLTIQGNILGPNWKGEPIPDNPQLGGIGFPPLNGSMFSVLIGGTTANASNLIAHNSGTGIAILSVKEGETTTFTSNNISILGNRIYGNQVNENYPLSKAGMGIDHAILNKDIQNLANSTITGDGPTPNDASDSDSGPNGFMNHPVISSVSLAENNLTVKYDLDAADSTDGNYRVEFFASDQEDSSGYGEGQIYLGSMTTTTGNSKQATIAVPNNINLSGKVLSATTTAINNTTPYGFGSTSEFSQAKAISVTSGATAAVEGSSGSLAETGVTILLVILLFIFVISTATIYVDYRRHKKPLLIADPHIKYTFSHHIRVVTLPLFRYRVSIRLSKPDPLGGNFRKF